MLLRLSSLFIPPIVKRINEIDAYRIQSRKQSSNPLESTRSLYTTPFIGNIHSSWRGFFPLEFQIYCRVSLAPLAAVGAGKKPRSLRRLALYRAQSLRFSRRSDSIIHLTEMSSGNYRINRVIKRCFRCSRGGSSIRRRPPRNRRRARRLSGDSQGRSACWTGSPPSRN